MKNVGLIMIGALLTQCTIPPQDPARPVLTACQILVKPGDTVYGIAHRYKVSARKLIYINCLASPYKLLAGQVLTLPEEARIDKEQVSRPFRDEKEGPRLLPQPSLQEGYDMGKKEEFGEEIGEETASFSQEAQERQMMTPLNPKLAEELKRAKERGESSISDSSMTQPLSCPKIKDNLKFNASFVMPVQGAIVRSFKQRGEGKCNGIRIGASPGTQVVSAESGYVFFIGDELGQGQTLVVIQHPNGWLSAYGPLDNIQVAKGQQIGKGHPIGCSTIDKGKHELYFELRYNRKIVNPLHYIK